MPILFDHLGLPEHARPIARALHDFDPTLSLERLPDGHPWLEDNPTKPYAVIHRSPAFPEYVIESYPESMLDHRIIANVAFGDANRHDWDLENFDPVTAAYHLVETRKRVDDLSARNELQQWREDRKYDRGRRSYV